MGFINVRVEFKEALREIRKRMTVARRETAKDIAFAAKIMFESTTQTIDESIKFRQATSKGGARIAVGTDSKKYENIVDGFDHTTLLVGPDKKRQGFQPKTKVRILASFEQVGIAYKNVLKTPQSAPGREFPQEIAEVLTTSTSGARSAKSIAQSNYKSAMSGRTSGI